jgi:hypothetical protein
MFDFIYISAANSTNEFKAKADFVCNGKNDELTIQKAIETCVKENKNLYLLNGIYNIEAFYDFGDGGPFAAISIPNAHREIKIIGQNHEYGFQKRYDNGVVFYVSKKALDTIKDSSVDVIRGTWTAAGIQNGSSLHMENMAIILADNQHPIRCIDLRRTDRVDIKNISLISYGDSIAQDSPVGLSTAPKIPTPGCIGLTMTDGSNYDYSNYTNVQAWGFDEGIQVGGEHVVCINCGATMGRYGFTFGNYEVKCGTNHPTTLINCLDERNINLPYYGRWCGDGDGKGGRLIGNQEIYLIGFNIERVATQTPGGKLGDLMREEIPGTWCGRIEYTAQPKWCALNDAAFKLWENDGSGSKIKTINSCHKNVCSTEERLSYFPSLGQQIYDTDLNKMLICIDPYQKTWVDFFGNKA